MNYVLVDVTVSLVSFDSKNITYSYARSHISPFCKSRIFLRVNVVGEYSRVNILLLLQYTLYHHV